MKKFLGESMIALQDTVRLIPDIEKLGSLIIDTYENDGKLILCGNGGSAADCCHIAAEFVGQYRKEDRELNLPCVVLGADLVRLTALANDYGYENAFAHELKTISKESDLLLVLSTSGNSENIIRCVLQAQKQYIMTAAITGGGMIDKTSCRHHVVKLGPWPVAIQQQVTMTIGHMLVEMVKGHFMS